MTWDRKQGKDWGGKDSTWKNIPFFWVFLLLSVFRLPPPSLSFWVFFSFTSLLDHSPLFPGTELGQTTCSCHHWSDSTAWIVFPRVREWSAFSQGAVEGGGCAVWHMNCLACCVWLSILLSAHRYVKIHARKGRGKANEQRIVSWLVKEMVCKVESEFRFKWKPNKSRTWILAIRIFKWNFLCKASEVFILSSSKVLCADVQGGENNPRALLIQFTLSPEHWLFENKKETSELN